jgi:hypothetical protein
MRGVDGMKLKYSFTAQDYIDFALRSVKNRNRKILIITGAACFMVLIVILLASNAPLVMIPICAIFVILICAISALLQKAIVKRSAMQNIKSAGTDFFKSDKTLELLDDGIESQSNIGVSKLRYESISNLSKDDRFAYIAVKGGNKLFIPLSTQGVSEFYGVLAEKIKNAAE